LQSLLIIVVKYDLINRFMLRQDIGLIMSQIFINFCDRFDCVYSRDEYRILFLDSQKAYAYLIQ
jgi:hypothetical protein